MRSFVASQSRLIRLDNYDAGSLHNLRHFRTSCPEKSFLDHMLHWLCTQTWECNALGGGGGVVSFPQHSMYTTSLAIVCVPTVPVSMENKHSPKLNIPVPV